jgi:mutator protein MutT
MATRIAIAVVERAGCFLIGQRPPNAALAGLWEFPGGKLEAGETPEVAAVRECREEADIEVVARSIYQQIEHEYPHGRVELTFVACEVAAGHDGVVPRPPFRWVPGRELKQYEFPAANAALLSELISKYA